MSASRFATSGEYRYDYSVTTIGGTVDRDRLQQRVRKLTAQELPEGPRVEPERAGAETGMTRPGAATYS
jgi:hypothetical protein